MRFVLPLMSAAVLSLPLVAAAHLPHQAPTPFPFRCPTEGLCLQSTEAHSLIGGIRHGDDEIRFHAIYRPGDDERSGAKDGNDAAGGKADRGDKESSAGSKEHAADANSDGTAAAGDQQASDGDEGGPWCVAITAQGGQVLVAKSGGSACDELDLAAPATFGVKPTGSSEVLQGDAEDGDAAAGSEDDGAEVDEQGQQAAIQSCLQHLLAAQPSPEHKEAWGQVVELARQAVAQPAEQD